MLKDRLGRVCRAGDFIISCLKKVPVFVVSFPIYSGN